MSRSSRALNACIFTLQEVQRGSDVTPEQKRAIEDVISDLKAIRRKPSLARHEMHQYVRTIAEKLLRIFRR